ncbi:MAG TPA: pyruvate dehydrogenase (acetyl-transferring) E1 component subunit alpha [Elusimicrobia bacterium]|nr:pyruvate dehydrogenase (acetyl-transferring) E1 component subunit alpha [Elusimicrobiota bacterium]
MYFDGHDPRKGQSLRILGPDGVLREDLRPDLSDARVKSLYERLSVMRVADRTALSLQREGRLGTYAPVYGQEAAQASAAFLEPQDWMVPSYRETGALWIRGVPLASLYRYWNGDERGMIFPKGLNALPIAIVVGSQPLHAVGLSWAMKLRGDPGVAAAYFGDGASSQGDVHEAMNFAGVFKTPTVFICQNNQFAISVPRSRQTAAATIAERAWSYGFPGIQIDGNDLFAVYGAMKEALDAARRGTGPRLIEMLTYRFGPHTTSDDPTKYRTNEDVEKHRPEDPLLRLRLYLKGRGLWSEAEEALILEKAQAEVEAEVRSFEAAAPAPVSDIFDYTYPELPPYLRRQRDEAMAGGETHG